MKLSKLIDRLKSYILVLNSFKNEDVEITTFSLLNKDQKEFKKECIYIGLLSELPLNNINANFLCVKDNEIRREDENLNICILDKETNKYDVLNYVAEIMNEELELASSMKKLLNVVYSNQGLQQLIDTAREISGRKMIVVDNRFKIMASSYDAKESSVIHEDINIGQYLDENIIEFIRKNNILSKIRDKGNKQYVKKIAPLNGALVVLIYIEEVEIGQLVIFEEGKRFKQSEFELMDSFSKILSIELQKTNFFNVNKELISNYLLVDLIEKNYVSEEVINRRFHYLSLIKASSFYIMVITNNKEGAFDSKIPFIIQSLKAFIPTDNCIVYKASLIAFIDGSLMHQLFDTKNIQFDEYLKINSLCVGISIKFTTLSSSKKYYLQALKANEIAQHYNLQIIKYDKCIKYIVADFINNEYDYKDFCHAGIMMLVEEDKKNKTNFLETLKYYIYFTDNPNEAAKVLNIHRNTLFYRINKIKKLTNIKLDNAEEIFEVYYSIKLFEFNNENR